MSKTEVSIRACRDEDIGAVTAIYRHAVLHTTGTFEIDPPDECEMISRFTRVTTRGYPFLVATRGVDVVAFAYVSAFRDRPAFRFLVEDSIYVRADMQDRGIGASLLKPLLGACETQGFRQIVAVIGDSNNIGSIKLHARFKFEPVGTLRAVGWKAGRWLDTVMMQCTLGDGATSPPPKDR